MRDLTNRFEIQVEMGPVHIGGNGGKQWRTIFYAETLGYAEAAAEIADVRVLDTLTNKYLDPKPRTAAILPFAARLG